MTPGLGGFVASYFPYMLWIGLLGSYHSHVQRYKVSS